LNLFGQKKKKETASALFFRKTGTEENREDKSTLPIPVLFSKKTETGQKH